MKYTIKAVMDFDDVTDGNVSMKWYEKAFGADDSTYTLVYTHTNPKPTDVSVLQPHRKVTTANYPDDTTYYVGFTIDNLNISEKAVAKIDLQDLTGAAHNATLLNPAIPNGYCGDIEFKVKVADIPSSVGAYVRGYEINEKKRIFRFTRAERVAPKWFLIIKRLSSHSILI